MQHYNMLVNRPIRENRCVVLRLWIHWMLMMSWGFVLPWWGGLALLSFIVLRMPIWLLSFWVLYVLMVHLLNVSIIWWVMSMFILWVTLSHSLIGNWVVIMIILMMIFIVGLGIPYLANPMFCMIPRTPRLARLWDRYCCIFIGYYHLYWRAVRIWMGMWMARSCN